MMLVLQFHLFYASQEPETTEHAEQVKNAQLIKFKQGNPNKKEQFVDHQIIQV